MAYVQLAAGSVIVKVWPFRLIVPARVAPVSFACTLATIVPEPVPELPVPSEIQVLSDGVAVQLQPLGAVTAK